MKYLPCEAAGEVIGVHKSTVRRLIVSGQLPATNIGTADRPRFRVAEDDLHEYMKARQVVTEAAS